MFIQEAVKKATEKGKLIYRTPYPFWKMEPTNSSDCVVIHADGKEPGRCWNPQADDLMANDWEVTE